MNRRRIPILLIFGCGIALLVTAAILLSRRHTPATVKYPADLQVRREIRIIEQLLGAEFPPGSRLDKAAWTDGRDREFYGRVAMGADGQWSASVAERYAEAGAGPYSPVKDHIVPWYMNAARIARVWHDREGSDVVLAYDEDGKEYVFFGFSPAGGARIAPGALSKVAAAHTTGGGVRATPSAGSSGHLAVQRASPAG